MITRNHSPHHRDDPHHFGDRKALPQRHGPQTSATPHPQRAGRTTTRSTTARAAPAYSDSPAGHSSQKPAEGAFNEDFQDEFCDFAPQSSKFQGWPRWWL